jgi:hypothetical protein
MNSGTVFTGTHRWIHLHDIGRADQTRHRYDVTDEVERKLVVERRIDGVVDADQQQRMAIRRSMRDHLGGDVGAGAGPILDDEGLPQTLRQPLTDQSRMDVAHTPRRSANDQVHRPCRIGLRPRDARQGWQCGSACGQMQKISAGKFHGTPP